MPPELSQRHIVLTLATAVVLSGCEWVDPGQPSDDIAALPSTPAFRQAPPPLRTGFGQPIRIATAKQGNLLVSDAQAQAVLAVSAETMQPTSALTIRGVPLAVGMAGNRIFVGNSTAKRVEVYDGRGRFRYNFDTPVQYPSDLAIDEQAGLVFVVDALGHDVKVFDLQGTLLGTISGPNTTNAATLHNPTGIAVDPIRQQVLVSDYPDPMVGGPGSVKIFAYSGAHITTLSPGGCGWLGCQGGFSRPQGLVFDADRIFVLDAFQALILVYDRVTLTPIAQLGGPNDGLRIPMDLAVDGGDLFVTSSKTGTVKALRGGAVVQ